MNGKILLFLSWRNLMRNRRRTLITASSIGLGFALALLSVGIGDYSHNSMIRNGIKMGEGHITIQPKGYLGNPGNHLYLPGGADLINKPVFREMKAKISPRIFLQALVSSPANSIGAGLQGVDVQTDTIAESLKQKLVKGSWLKPGDKKGVVIGSRMAKKLKLKVGNKLIFLVGGEKGEVHSAQGRVRGVFKTNLEQLDAFLVLSDLSFTRRLLPVENVDPGAVTRLAIFLDNPEETKHWKNTLKADALPPLAVVLDWGEMMPELVNFILVDDAGNYVWMLIILAVVAFGILNTLLMSVLERTREFGLVQALGMRPGTLWIMVLTETVLLGLLSLTVGGVIGFGGHLFFVLQGVDLSAFDPELLSVGGVMMDPIMRSELSWGRLLTLTSIVFGTTLVSGLYPAFRATRVLPLAAMRT